MLIKHTAIYLAGKALPAILALSALIIFTRVLTPEEYGIYSLTILGAGLGSAVLLQWVVLGVGRYLPDCKDKTAQHKLLGTARSLVFIISAVMILLSLLAWRFQYLLEFSVIYYLVGLLAATQAFYDLNLRISNAALDPSKYGRLLALKSVLGFILGITVLYLGFGVEGLVLATVISLIVGSAYNRRIWATVPLTTFDRECFNKMVAYGAPLTVTFLLVFIIDASDRFFIDRIIGPSGVGFYSVAYELTQYSVGALATVVHLAAFPLIVSALAKHGTPQAGAQLRKTFILVVAVITPVCVGLAVSSSSIAYTVIGSQFSAEAAQVIPWIAASMFFSTVKSFYFDYAFQLASATRMQIYTVAVAASVNIALNILLIPIYGTVGAAAATLVAFITATILSIVLGSRIFPMPPLPWLDFGKVCVATVFMFIVMTFAHVENPMWELTVNVVAGGATYVACLFIFNFVNVRNDWRNVFHAS